MEIVLLDENCLPTKAHDTDAGYDLYLSQSVTVPAHQTKVVSAGFKIQLPKGTTAFIKPRSSVFKKGINIDGVIDQGYTGVVGIMIQNTNNYKISFDKYERVAQMIILSYHNEKLIVVDQLKQTNRGEGGFGSTGKK